MKKRIAPAVSVQTALEGEHWYNLEGLAEVEVTSENPAHPIEGALLPGNGRGWKAGTPGKQTVRVIFDAPQDVHRLQLVFVEDNVSRTQEFVLRAGADPAKPSKEILRQQFNFTPISSEVEDYKVELGGVKVLELEIQPDVGNPESVASLAEWRIG